MTHQDETISGIKAECIRQGMIMPEQIAYVLATVNWETRHTFRPVKEAYWLSEGWRKRHLWYYPYYGRGFPQVTHKENYEKFGKLLHIDLVGNPDLALSLDNSIYILVHGFKHGTFTGKSIWDYINEERVDYIGARKIINGKDRAHEIAKLAEEYYSEVYNDVRK